MEMALSEYKKLTTRNFWQEYYYHMNNDTIIFFKIYEHRKFDIGDNVCIMRQESDINRSYFKISIINVTLI